MPQAAVYAATKSALSTLTECLAAQLEADGANVRAAVFYPSGRGLLDTGLWTADRNRPTELAREKPRDTPTMTIASLREKGIPIQPLDELAQLVVDGIRSGTFWMILDHDRSLQERLVRIKERENPTVVHELGV
jgi:short-subunit dehydrogenase